LARTGKKKQANYRIVVADHKRAVTAKFKEILGWYNPHTKEIRIDKEKAQDWLQKGANPTSRTAILMQKNGIDLPKWVEIKEKNKKPKKEKEVKEETPKAEAKPETEEAEAVEAPEEQIQEEPAEVKEEVKEEIQPESNPTSPEASKDEEENPETEAKE